MQEFSEKTRLEQELYKNSHRAEYERLKFEYESFRNQQYELNQGQQKAQEEIVTILQQQFSEVLCPIVW